MSKTFTDENGITVEFNKYNTEVDTSTDIVTDKITRFFVIVDEVKYQVSEDVYNAVQKYID